VKLGNVGNVGITGITLNQNLIDRNTGNGVSITAPGTVNTFSNNSILGNGLDGCAGCNPVGPGA
jgi:hypothetical protein